MSEPIISVENISKRYLLGHQSAAQSSTFGELVAHEVRSFARNALAVATGRQIVYGDELEEFWALKNVGFDVEQGDLVGIVGRNGAGKSTLLKILSRITEPTEGRVILRGRIASLLEVGTGFHPELSGRENIYLNGAILGMSRREIDRKFDEIVEFAEVERFLDTPVKRYSSGMYVRLAFAVAAHLEPDILIVDEVLAVGDAEFQKKCLGKMNKISREGGRTVICVSHNMGLLSSICSKVVWLDGGTLREYGPTQDVISAYQSRKNSTRHKFLDLSTVSRPGYIRDERVRIESLEWDSDLPLRHNEPVSLRIGLRSYAQTTSIALGIHFLSKDGTRVLTYNSDLPNMIRPDTPAAGHLSATVRLESLPLQPDDYSLDITLRSGDLYMLDNIAGAAQIEVAAGPKTPAFMSQKFAGVRLPSDWSWNLTQNPSEDLSATFALESNGSRHA